MTRQTKSDLIVLVSRLTAERDQWQRLAWREADINAMLYHEIQTLEYRWLHREFPIEGQILAGPDYLPRRLEAAVKQSEGNREMLAKVADALDGIGLDEYRVDGAFR